jgi:hypothetical protein
MSRSCRDGSLVLAGMTVFHIPTIAVLNETIVKRNWRNPQNLLRKSSCAAAAATPLLHPIVIAQIPPAGKDLSIATHFRVRCRNPAGWMDWRYRRIG